MEITMRNLLAGGTRWIRRDFLARADLLAACGMTVLISDYFEYYRLAAYLAWQTQGADRHRHGRASLIELFDEKYYTQLPGGILESFGRLFKNDLKLYVYPLRSRRRRRRCKPSTRSRSSRSCESSTAILTDRGSFVQLDNYKPEYLPIFSRDVLKRIAAGMTGPGKKWCHRRSADVDQEARLLRV